MDQVIDLISDDDEPIVQSSPPQTQEFEETLKEMGICDLSALRQAVSESFEKHAVAARIDIQIIQRSQQCQSEMVNDLVKDVTDIQKKFERLGNPLSIRYDCDKPADVTIWDPENQLLLVPNPERVVDYIPGQGIRRAEVKRDEDEENFIDSGEESGGSDIVVLPVIERGSASKVKVPAVGDLVEHKIATKGEDVLFHEDEDVLSYWVRGKLNQVYHKDGVQHYAISCTSTTIVRSEDSVVSSKPQPCRIPLKQRVVAHYRYKPDQKTTSRLMAGFVAEPLRGRPEYLIFFDNGKAGYVPHDECFYFHTSDADEAIRKISEKSPYYGTFLNKYFQSYPELPLVREKAGQQISFLHENKMIVGKVANYYHSLVQIVLPKKANEKTAESQWLFRGSWMLRDIFLALFPNDNLSMTGPFRATQRRKRATHKVSIVAPVPRNKKKEAKEKKQKKKTTTRKSLSRVPQARVVYADADFDSDYTDCSTDQEQSGVRGKKFVKTQSSVHRDRMIFERRVEAATPKTVFPMRVPCFPGSAQRRLIEEECKSYTLHDCSTDCLPISSRSEYDAVHQLLGKENPFAIPLILGWSREVRSHEFVSRTEKWTDGDVYYRSPCGKSISSAKELHRHLSRTQSAIPVDLFAFDPDLEVYCRQKDMGCFYYDPDLSAGVEDTPIPVVNELEDRGPDPFSYTKHFTLDPETRYEKIVTKKSYDPETEAPFDSNFMSCCSCTDNCADPLRCECQTLTRDAGRIIYPVHDDNYSCYSFRRLNQVIHTGVYECHSKCSCNNSCLNRLIQLKNRNMLQIFKTGHDKGWGIRALHDIPKGTFLCQYVARILTPEQGNDGNHDDTYFADLDHVKQMEANKRYHREHPEDFIEEDDDSEEMIRLKREMVEGIQFMSLVEKFGESGTYVVDAIREGNIGRFFNHSCDPNCDVQNVFLHTHDPRFPCICLFTTRTVKAMEELVWDYGYEVDSIENRKMWCKCGSRKCRKRLL